MPNKSNKKSSKESNKITIVVLGEGGVGKSSMTLNYIRNEFSESYDPTIDDSYLTTVVLDGMEWLIEVIDTAGQEEYRGLWVEHALSQGDAFIIVYAINSESSLRILPSFLQSISQNKNFDNLKSSGSSHGMQAVAEDKSDNLNMKRCPFPFAVAGNKSDLESNRAVPTQDGSRLASLAGGLFCECSAKADVNVKEVFNELIRATIRLRRLRAAHKKNPKTSKLSSFYCKYRVQ
ncbi:P-loop containing nucleoside triphosphate hydrolase protein [Phakopsora pachyrhizi]|uniref:P-loop containing nucleoside triphosphate hydrolase protein n=1 Tax=Phakopsora pachyrhizi TaxID=170000 RepID=A0AAV0AVY2_PHAPC|nr:P-loop containing nucleoside triphosphate hydrolase protein [Phakopsora pachyrhizi]